MKTYFFALFASSFIKARDVHLDEYLEDRPEMKNFISNVLKPFFILSSPETIPVILIDKKFDIEAVTRIFSTLNTTGKMLTAFELVVAILYPFDIDLIESVIKAKEKHIYYKHMDKEGETVFQTIALLNGQTLKAKLPKTIDQINWNQFNEQAFEKLNMLITIWSFLRLFFLQTLTLLENKSSSKKIISKDQKKIIPFPNTESIEKHKIFEGFRSRG